MSALLGDPDDWGVFMQCRGFESRSYQSYAARFNDVDLISCRGT